MITLVKSVLGKSNPEIKSKLQGMIEDSSSVLSKQDLDLVNYLIKQYDITGVYSDESLFSRDYPGLVPSLQSAKPVDEDSISHYISRLSNTRRNQQAASKLMLISQSVLEHGLTTDDIEALREYQTVEDDGPEETLTDRERYQLAKKRDAGLITFVPEIDNIIGGMPKGFVTVVAGFSGQFKCVSENERILTDRGFLRIKDIYELGVDSGILVQSEYGLRPLYALHDEGVKQSYIVSIGGIPVETSPVHRFRVFEDGKLVWKQACELKVGDKVAQSLLPVESHGEEDDVDFWRFLGQLYGDGGITQSDINGRIVYLSGVTESVELMRSEEFFQKYFGRVWKSVTPGRKEGYKEQVLLRAPYSCCTRSEINCLVGKNSHTKVFPYTLYTKSMDCWKAFLYGLYETDGCSGVNLGFTMSNRGLLVDISRLLSGLGISSTLIYTGASNDSYHLRISGARSKSRFLDIVGSVSFKSYTSYSLDEYSDTSRGLETRAEFEKIRSKKSYSRRDYKVFGRFGVKGGKCTLKKIEEICAEYPEFFESEYFSEIIASQLTYQKVTNIVVSSCHMYDLSVVNSPTYLLNGFVTHNTTWGLNMAYHNAYDKGYNVVYISLEVPKQDVKYNLWSLHSTNSKFPKFPFIGHDRIRKGLISEEEENYLFDTIVPDLEASTGKLILLDETDFTTFSFGEIRQKLEDIDDKTPIDAVFWDQASLFKFYMQGGKNMSAGEVINQYVSFIRRLSIRFRRDKETGEWRKLCNVILSQCNRQGWASAVRRNGQYSLTALAEANELERCASFVFTTFTDENMKLANEAKVQMLKSRYGQTINEPVVVFVDPEQYVFGERSETGSQAVNVSMFDQMFGMDPIDVGMQMPTELDLSEFD